MARKNLSPIEGQGLLFISIPDGREYQGDSLRTWQEMESNAQPEPQSPQTDYEGPHVKLADRATHLLGALDALSKRNQRLGFDYAVHARPYNDEIWGRYKEITPIVIDGAQKNAEDLLLEAKRNFWKATGFSALKGSGLMPTAEIEVRSRRMWRDFSSKYGDPDKRRARENLKRTLQGQKSRKSQHEAA